MTANCEDAVSHEYATEHKNLSNIISILGSWYRASSINVEQTNKMQLGSDLYYYTS